MPTVSDSDQPCVLTQNRIVPQLLNNYNKFIIFIIYIYLMKLYILRFLLIYQLYYNSDVFLSSLLFCYNIFNLNLLNCFNNLLTNRQLLIMFLMYSNLIFLFIYSRHDVGSIGWTTLLANITRMKQKYIKKN